MIRLTQQQTRDWLAIHGWSGIVLGLLLYAVICTGTVAVFAREIGHWSSPLSSSAGEGLPAQVNAAVQRLSAEADPDWREEIALFAAHGGRLYLRFEGHLDEEHEDEHDEDEAHDDAHAHEHYGVEYQLDRHTLEVLRRTEGSPEVMSAAREAGALSRFFIELHVRLHLPNPWGLFLTGVLGLMMMVAAVTGFVVHRHLIRELFTIRRNREAMLRSRDAHVIAGTWNLPFAFLLAFTGSFFSFAGSVGLPAMAMVVFGGDEERAIEEVFGAPPASDATPAEMADLDLILADAHARAGVAPSFLGMRFHGRADAMVRTFVPPPEGELIGRSFIYSGVTGEFVREQPSLVGKVPSVGNTVASLMAPLHFGNFGGVISKAVWFALGFAGGYVTLTGMLLWTLRRAEQRAWQRMATVVSWTGYGLPLAMALTPYGFFIAQRWAVDVWSAQWAAFALAAVAAAAWMVRRPAAQARAGLIAATGVALLGIPLLRLLCGGPGWVVAWQGGLDVVIAVDVVLLLSGGLCLWLFRSRDAGREQTLRQVPESAS